ncbi:SDR family oxidoreductase [Sphingobium sp. JS3065]|jgi:NAD(P)-dependent dehydrogenase (short-subunit alcohol dehydrogenase family)|uniref:SDR family NAD(P)-dependent oxidoreductase n=1 Tax=Sphingobium sp. JS3065 TaxID=2970925 RepID=UPI0022641606|nr:SDR family oxidoreductase [Sphingobium sp. JS3065]UZW57234.1 SDR family oxidoreductase [Sphingobium sp. JS3065]
MLESDMRLRGKTAAITGAAGDIGQALARRFSEEGARVALIDRDEAGLATIGAAFGETATTVAADITDESAVRAAADAVRSAFGHVDILIANAGIEQSYSTVTDLSREEFDRVVSVNLTGAFLTAKHFMPIVADGGSVIFTSSIAGLMAFPAYSAYCASKAGLIGLMRSTSLDVASRRVRCNTIHPGPVKSKMLARSAHEATDGGDTDGWYAAMAGMAKMGRLVEPEDVVGLALFLASDESAMIAGQSIAVDGGIVQ